MFYVKNLLIVDDTDIHDDIVCFLQKLHHFQNYQNQRTGIYNTLAGIAGLGQNAQNIAAQTGQNMVTAAGQLGVGAAGASYSGAQADYDTYDIVDIVMPFEELVLFMLNDGDLKQNTNIYNAPLRNVEIELSLMVAIKFI